VRIVIVVRLHSVDHPRISTELLQDADTDFDVRTLNFMVERFTDVVNERGANSRVCVETDFSRHDAGEPGDFGGIAVFLASAASDFLTGTAIPVDGGYSVQG
jgi:NAD(P)-dependent dehydrogenase (short-subunit alcohol dehydrogenase family)